MGWNERDPRGSRRAPGLVLVVDDNERSRKLARAVLEMGGFHVLGASTGQEAIDLAADQDPDLVLLDLQLPDLDGFTVLERLRAEVVPTPPVVALTAFAMAGDRDRALASGFGGYLTKPIDVPTFATTVRSFLPEPAAGPR